MLRIAFAVITLLALEAMSASMVEAACFAGEVPMRSGGCMPRGHVECGHVYCKPGQLCVGGLCRGGSFGRLCPSTGLRCPVGSACNPYGGRGCYNPRTQISCGTHNCPIGTKCGTALKCITTAQAPPRPTTKSASDRPPPATRRQLPLLLLETRSRRKSE